MVDYAQLGLKIGLEIHRQIESHKLFCHCASELQERQPDTITKRELRSVASEMGEHDTVAKFELGKKRHALYQGYEDTTCLVELDEEPIHPINQDALAIVLQVCKLLHMHVVDEIQVMRKQVIDYSNTSGFQRTALIGVHGYVQTPSGKVGIDSVCIEEDSARRMTTEKEHVVFRLDRLGIPLIEIATAPDMKSPEHAKEVAEYLGMILKSTGRFKSGIGTIRQDLNVSITRHPRVEIKGVQELRMIPKIIELEIDRQQQLLSQGKSEVRQAQPDGSTTFLRPMPGSSRMYVETDHHAFSVHQLYTSLTIPELLTEKTVSLEQRYKLPSQLARELLESEKLNLFEHCARAFPLEPSLIAHILIETPKELKTRFKIDPEKLREKDFTFVIEHIHNKTITKEAALDILAELAQGKIVHIDMYKPVSLEKIEKDIDTLISQNANITPNALMGMVMNKYKGKIEGKKVMEFIKEKLT
mgnify:CR=1 FL=1